jgi:phosphate:Na+ symporter
MLEENVYFSAAAKAEVEELSRVTISCYAHCIEVLDNQSREALKLVMAEEDDTDNIVKRLRSSHIKRLASNECSPMSGVSFLDILTNMERIADHSLNIAESVL